MFLENHHVQSQLQSSENHNCKICCQSIKLNHWIHKNFLAPGLSSCNLAYHHPLLLQTLTVHPECCGTACLHFAQSLPLYSLSVCTPVAPSGCSKSFQNTGVSLQANEGHSNSVSPDQDSDLHSNSVPAYTHTTHYTWFCLSPPPHPLSHEMIFWLQKHRILPPVQCRPKTHLLCFYCMLAPDGLSSTQNSPLT